MKYLRRKAADTASCRIKIRYVMVATHSKYWQVSLRTACTGGFETNK